jgi:hypothetical protein
VETRRAELVCAPQNSLGERDACSEWEFAGVTLRKFNTVAGRFCHIQRMNAFIACTFFLALCTGALWLFLRVLVALPSRSQQLADEDVSISN